MKYCTVLSAICVLLLVSLSTVVSAEDRWTEYSAKVTAKSHTDKLYYISVEVQGYGSTGLPYKTELSVTSVYYHKVALSSQIPVEEKAGDWRTVQGYYGEPVNKTKVNTPGFETPLVFMTMIAAVLIVAFILPVGGKRR